MPQTKCTVSRFVCTNGNHNAQHRDSSSNECDDAATLPGYNINPKDVDKGWKETNFMSVGIPKCTTMSELYIATEVQPVEKKNAVRNISRSNAFRPRTRVSSMHRSIQLRCLGGREVLKI